MSRRWFLPAACLIGLLMAPGVQAQKLHAVVVGDESEWAHWGEFLPNIQMDMTQIWVTLTNNVPESQLNMLTVTIESPEDGDPAQILAALDELRPAANDTLLFYFTGHGGLDDQGSYLSLEKGKLYRDTVQRRMADKGDRLTVMLTDCCNVRGDGQLSHHIACGARRTRKGHAGFSGVVLRAGRHCRRQCLFARREHQFFLKKDDEMYRGSLFTRSLVDYLDRRRTERLSWDELLRDVSVVVHVEFGRNYPDGVPMAKGPGRQSGQNVYAASYPGMPKTSGPRTV